VDKMSTSGGFGEQPQQAIFSGRGREKISSVATLELLAGTVKHENDVK